VRARSRFAARRNSRLADGTGMAGFLEPAGRAASIADRDPSLGRWQQSSTASRTLVSARSLLEVGQWSGAARDPHPAL
jgi:hypothetical protein